MSVSRLSRGPVPRGTLPSLVPRASPAWFRCSLADLLFFVAPAPRGPSLALLRVALLSCALRFFALLRFLGFAQLCMTLLSFALLCVASLCFALFCFASLCFALLCFALLCFASLCFASLCFALLCFASLCFPRLHVCVLPDS